MAESGVTLNGTSETILKNSLCYKLKFKKNQLKTQQNKSSKCVTEAEGKVTNLLNHLSIEFEEPWEKNKKLLKRNGKGQRHYSLKKGEIS